jgi:enoyl-CoA hydratase/carnithine racemase
MEMLLLGEPISALEAQQYGLVNRVVKEADLEMKTLEMLNKIIVTPPEIVALGKRAFYTQSSMEINQAYEFAERVMVDNIEVKNGQEGISAFVNKRKPKWD